MAKPLPSDPGPHGSYSWGIFQAEPGTSLQLLMESPPASSFVDEDRVELEEETKLAIKAEFLDGI